MRKTTSISPLPLVLATLPFAAFAQIAHADDTCKVDGKLVSYAKPPQLPQKFDTRCDNADGKCKKLDLKGWLYTPKGGGKHQGVLHPVTPPFEVGVGSVGGDTGTAGSVAVPNRLRRFT